MKKTSRKKSKTMTTESKIGIINAVNSPLGFFTLVVLVIESTIGFLVYKDKIPDSSFIISGMLLLLFGLVAVVAIIAYKRPESLGVSTSETRPKNIEEKSQNSVAKIEENSLNDNSSSLILYRFDQPPIDKLIMDANEEIWINGIDLGISITKMGLFLSQIEKGVKLKFMIMGLDEERLVQECSSYRGISDEELKNRISFSTNSIKEKLANKYPQRVDFRVFKHRPPFGFFIIDPDNQMNGKMNINPYTYKGFGMNEPLIHITKKNENRLFGIYLEQFELMWNDSEILES